MGAERHSWIEVNQLRFLRALRKLARMPKPPKDARKLIVSLEAEELVLGTGVASVRTEANGKWDTPAILPYQTLDLLISLANSAAPENPVVIEGIGDHLQIGRARLSCSFQNPAIAVRGILAEERKIERIKEEDPLEFSFGARHERAQTRVVCQLKELHEDCVVTPPPHQVIVTFPDIPHLLFHLTATKVEVRIVAEPDADPAESLARSRAWKRLSYEAVGRIGIEMLMIHAERAAQMK